MADRQPFHQAMENYLKDSVHELECMGEEMNDLNGANMQLKRKAPESFEAEMGYKRERFDLPIEPMEAEVGAEGGAEGGAKGGAEGGAEEGAQADIKGNAEEYPPRHATLHGWLRIIFPVERVNAACARRAQKDGNNNPVFKTDE